jgi:hypothetical protein
MADYYAILARKLQETADDPGKMREVVYEAARLALRWQVQEQWPQLSIIQSRREISELEGAIARLEANAAGQVGRGKTDPSDAVNCSPPKESERDDVARRVEEPLLPPREPFSAELVGLEAVAGSLGGRGNAQPGKSAANAAVDDDAPNMVEESTLRPRDPPPAEPAAQEPIAGSLEGRCIREPAATGLAVSRQNRGKNEATDPLPVSHAPRRDQPGVEPFGVYASISSFRGRDKYGLGGAARAFQTAPQERHASVEPNAEDTRNQLQVPAQASDGFRPSYRERGSAGEGFAPSHQSPLSEPEEDDTLNQPRSPSQAEPAGRASDRARYGYREPGSVGESFRAGRQSRSEPVESSNENTSGPGFRHKPSLRLLRVLGQATKAVTRRLKPGRMIPPTRSTVGPTWWALESCWFSTAPDAQPTSSIQPIS